MHTFFTLQAQKGQREFKELVIRASTRERALVNHPETVFILDITPHLDRTHRCNRAVVCGFRVLGHEVTILLFGRKSDIARTYSRRVVEGSVVASHPRVLRSISR